MPNQTRLANAFIGFMVAAALATVLWAAQQAHTWHLYQGLALLVLAMITSRMKVTFPGLTGNMSVNLPFFLFAVAELNPVEALVVACLATIVQTIPTGGRKLRPGQMLFNVSMMAVACGLAAFASHPSGTIESGPLGPSELLFLGAAVFFFGQTVPVAAIISLTDGGAPQRIWWNIAHLSFPYFVLSAALTSSIRATSGHPGWQAALLLLAVMYGVYRSFRTYFGDHDGFEHQPALAMRAHAGR